MRSEAPAASDRIEALELRLARLRALAEFRRTIRVTEEVEEIAALGQRFALDVFHVTSLAIYCADAEDADFALLVAPPSTSLPPSVDRGGPLAAVLEAGATSTRDDTLLAPYRTGGGETIAFALRASPTQLVGVLTVTGTGLDIELVTELVFDLESALSSRILARLRTEELAMLAVQERELVGLLREVEARDEIIQRDLEEARQFQRHMLGLPPKVPGAAVEIVYEPLGLVGGDLYAVALDGERLRLFVADATGHGVRASLTTMFIKSGYEAVRLGAPDPAALLAALNDTIAQTYRSAEMLFSAVCVDLDLESGRLAIASAAHPPVCVIRRGDAQLVEGGGAFLGVRSGIRFSTQELVIEPGDAVYLYTDGFVEARRQNELFGEPRLLEVLVDAHRAGEAAGPRVLDAVREFLAGTPLDDDGTLLGVRYAIPNVPEREQ